MKSTTVMCFLIAVAGSSCLMDNPAALCGEKWAAQTVDATGKDGAGATVLIKKNGQWMEGSVCLTESAAAGAGDPMDASYQAVQNAAISACETQAANLNLGPPITCSSNVGTPFYKESCVMALDECNPSMGTDTGGSETGGSNGFADLGTRVVCLRGTCDVAQSLIDEVLGASDAQLSGDGTEIEAHFVAGQQDGYQINSAPSGSVAEALGFQDGDVATKVAGLTIDSSADLIDAANLALHANSVVVEYVRSGTTSTTTFEVQ